MKLRFHFNIKCWALGAVASDKIPLSGYIDGVEYMAAAKNTLLTIFLGPILLHLWIGPQPREMS